MGGLETLRSLLRQAEGFDEDTRKVLDMAAVVGNRASFGVLESVSGLQADAVLTAVMDN